MWSSETVNAGQASGSAKTVTVIGATGYAGGHIVTELLDRDYRVTGVARSIPADSDPRIVLSQGNIGDLDLMSDLIAKSDVLVLAARASKVAENGNTYSDAVRDLLPLAANASTRIGVVGGAGSLWIPGRKIRHIERVNYGSGDISRNLAEATAQGQVLTVLEDAGTTLDWFYVSPPAVFGAYATGERTGEYRLGTDELLYDNEGKSYISGEDFAIAFVDEIDEPKHRSQRFTVAY